jgi:hypothetical protein
LNYVRDAGINLGVASILVVLYLSLFSIGRASTDGDILQFTPRTRLLLISDDNNLTYRNDTFSFKIDYPTTWKVIENNPDSPLSVQEVVVNFYSPPELSSDFFSENLGISATKLNDSQIKTLDGLAEALTPYYREIFGVRQPLSSQDVFLGSNPAKKITFSYDLFGKTVENTQIFSIESGYVYVINYLCEESKCSTYLPTFNKMVDSFGFTLRNIM